jgi:dihydropyrimidinase
VSAPFDRILRNGTVVTGSGTFKADVAFRGQSIAAVEPEISGSPEVEEIDCTGKYLMPGVIDVHVHPVYLDDMEQSSLVAAHGGTTSILHFHYAKKGSGLYSSTREFIEEGKRISRVDFGVHAGLFGAEAQVPEIPETMKLGVRSFKFFMTYIKQGWTSDDYQLTKAMDILAENGGMAMVHCENGGAIDYLEDKYLKGPNASAAFFNASRPDALEEEAIFRAISIAEVTKCPLYIVHVTAGRSLRPILRAREEGQIVYAETCIHYLSLTRELIDTLGAYAKVGPPLREEADKEALWKALRDELLQVISTDHAAKEKDPKGAFLDQGFGLPQIEILLPIAYDEGVNKGRISLVRLVQVLSENPAKIWGLYPRKGAIAVGSDADVVVLDPTRRYTITHENQHSNAGYTLYNGREVLGWPEMTFQRGRPLLRDGEIHRKPGEGAFMPTAPAGTFL